MNNLIQRTITGILFIVVVVCSLIWSPIPFTLLFLLFTLVALWEFFSMILQRSNFHLIASGMLAGAVIYATITLYALGFADFEWLLLNFVMINMVFLLELVFDGSSAIRNTAYTILGVVYIALPFALLNFLYVYEGHEAYNPLFLLGYFILTWTYDTLAYISGRIFGRHKLFPEVSPQKTYEGAIIGGLFTLLAAYLVFHFIGQADLASWLVIALIVIIFGTYGDLIESMFKRNFNVKDIGKALPGHGGVLDRFDGMLFSTSPVLLYYYLIL